MIKIIVIEDDLVLLTMYRIFLTMEGYEVILYTTGKSVINNIFFKPDLFILDHNLPDGITGLDICRTIRKNNTSG
jgi:DNA-binding response OmpR family regulator